MQHCMFRPVRMLALGATIGLLSGFPSGLAHAASDEDVAALRAELASIRQDYDARLAALAQRVAAAEARAAAAERRADRAQQAPGTAASSANAFNPAFSAILQGRAATFSGPDGTRDIPGFLLGEETGRGPEGLSLSETEITASANADDKFYGLVTASLSQDADETEIEIEEAYLQTLALPYGLVAKAGQFFSGIGYHNAKHSHAWDFVDPPLAYEAMLGTQLLDPGLQLSWIAPTDLYFELSGELLSGDHYPGGGGAHSGFGTYTLSAKLSGEVGDSNTWLAGLSYIGANPRGRASEDRAGSELLFSGDSDLAVASLVWKWAPGGNFVERNLVLQTEWLHRRERGRLAADTDAGAFAGSYDADQDGVYTQAVYQFMPRWRVGLRYDWLANDDDTRGLPADLFDERGNPRRVSAMIDFSNTEFSRLRLQWNREWGGLERDNAFFIQYILSVGSHGAHQF